jgi:glutathione S-transferase
VDALTRLHYAPGSAALAPHATLAEIGVPYELVRVERDEAGRPSAEYVTLNPWGKIPTLEDGDFVLTESAAICLYLAEKFPEARLAPPAGTRDRAELYRWLLWLSNTVQETQLRHFYPDRYGGDGVKEAADAALARHYDLIERHLDGREWLVGEERTVADFFLFMLTRWGRNLEPAAWVRPNLRAHFLRALDLRGPRAAVEEQGLALPPFALVTPDEQLAAIERLDAALSGAGIDYWLFGGWAVDFWVGSVTRRHEDVDAFARRADYDAISAALEAGGWEHLRKDTDVVGTRYLHGNTEVELTFFEPGENGRAMIPIPEGTIVLPMPFGDDRRELDGVSARTIPLELLRGGKSAPREAPADAAKDVADFEALSRVG